MNYCRKLYIFLLLLMISSCECYAKKKTVVVVDSIQVKINNSKKTNNVEALINQCLSYPKYAEQIREYLLFNTNYEKVSNDRLEQFIQMAGSDSVLLHGFEALIIERHQKKEDIDEVVNDIKNYRIYQDLLANYLLFNVDYQEYTYDQLCGFRKAGISEVALNHGFTYKINCLQDSVLSLLDNRQVDKIFSYYNEYEKKYSFLTQLLKTAIINHISTYDYKRIRTMKQLAKNSTFGNEFSTIYYKEREKQKNAVKSSVQNLRKSDASAINYWRLQVTSLVDFYIASHIGDMIRECGKQKYPKAKREIDSKFNEILHKYIDFNQIRQIVYANLSSLEDCLNKSHKSYVYQITGNPAVEDIPYLQILNLRSQRQLTTQFDLTALYAISQIQNEPDGAGAALSVGGFLLGLVSGGLGLLATAASAYHSYDRGKSAAEREGVQLKLFANSLVKKINATKKSIVDDITKEIMSRNNSCFMKMEQMIYEKY